jgi:glycosyltransferase involved in cell wall biosynthesis
MIHGKKVVVVMPAYNAEKTLERTHAEIPFEFVDEVILVDDASRDETSRVARELGITTIVHPKNRGYGGNQKTCYKAAVEAGADVVVMLHPDYQYTPKLLTAMASLVAIGQYDFVLASRILCGNAIAGGMPPYKYISNRLLTLAQNILMGAKLSEYHTGYRAFSRDVLLNLPLEENSDNFVFDNQMIAQAMILGYRPGEVACPTKYFPEASSINFRNSVVYGFGVLRTSWQYFCQKHGLGKWAYLNPNGKKLEIQAPSSGLPTETEPAVAE